MRRPAPATCLLLLFLFVIAAAVTPYAGAQDLPSSIRGYKVHRQSIEITEPDSPASSEKEGAAVDIDAPRLAEVSLTGITFEIEPEFRAFEQSGQVDFLSFHNFRVNGIAVTVAEYRHPFEFRKREPLRLPEAIRIFTPAPRVVQAAWREMVDSKEEWTVEGRVFVFGRFRKYGMSFKRVVPVDISLSIKNPLR